MVLFTFLPKFTFIITVKFCVSTHCFKLNEYLNTGLKLLMATYVLHYLAYYLKKKS